MHEAYSVIETILCVRGNGIPEGRWELDQYLGTVISGWYFQDC